MLLLATARRRGDIHAIDPSRITYTATGAIVEPVPRYLPKIRSTAEGEARYAPMIVRSLTGITDDPAELLLCPVHALKIYDALARKRSPNRKRFFVSIRPEAHPVCKTLIILDG